MDIKNNVIRLHDTRGREIVTFASRIDMVQRGPEGKVRWFGIGGQRIVPYDTIEAEAVYNLWLNSEQTEVEDESKSSRKRAKKQGGPLAPFRKKPDGKTKTGI